MEHTHLVKGLDLALLAKVRGELSKQQQPQEASKQAAVSAAGKKREPVVVRDGEMRRVCFTLFNKLHPHARRFGQALAALEMRLLTVRPQEATTHLSLSLSLFLNPSLAFKKEEMSCADAARLSGTVSSGKCVAWLFFSRLFVLLLSSLQRKQRRPLQLRPSHRAEERTGRG